jgi:hypothetical protein
MRRQTPFCMGLALGTAACLFSTALAGDPCVSGLKPGEKPGPYSAIVAVGKERGEAPHCFICDTAEHPAVIVFARHLDDPLAKLVSGIDKAVADNKKSELRGWVTFLNDDQSAFDPLVVDWAKKHAIRNVPLAVFEDLAGPPTYKLTRDADVTVLLFTKHKVVNNFAFRSGELTDERIAEILKAIPAVLEGDKK